MKKSFDKSEGYLYSSYFNNCLKKTLRKYAFSCNRINVNYFSINRKALQ